MKIHDLLPYIKETRRFGATYIHVAVRKAVCGWQGVQGTLDGKPITATFCGYGRSLQSGGHKYKAYLRYVDNDKPVRTKDFSRVQA